MNQDFWLDVLDMDYIMYYYTPSCAVSCFVFVGVSQ